MIDYIFLKYIINIKMSAPKLVVLIPIYNRAKEKIAESMIDVEYYNLVKNFNWFLVDGYARAQCNYKRYSLHKLILENDDPYLEVDHINRNKLDNRRCNLRIVTHGMNQANKHPKSNTGYKGVTYYEIPHGRKHYRAHIKFSYEQKQKWCYTLEEAIETRKQWELKYYGCTFD